MSALAGGVLLLALAIVLVPVGVVLLQAICAAWPRVAAPMPGGTRPRLAALIPAHDESTGVLPTLASLAPQLAPGDRMLVVADNCSDDTARVASSAGAEVVERHDPSRRGKGYALDFGVRHLESDPPDVVVIVDADCIVAGGAIDRLARIAASSGRPVQALYLMRSADAGRGARPVAEFAWIVKNQVRPLGFLRLGLPCQLMGTGMAVPWHLLREASLASGHLVEDMKLGIELARAGMPPLFCPEALVTSAFPASEEGARQQRTRWEHGHLSVIAADVPCLLRDAAAGRGAGLLALALDLSVPPLSLLVMMVGALLAASLGYALASGVLAPLWVAATLALMTGAAIGLAWLKFGRGAVSFSGLLEAIVYACGKIPLYVRYAIRRQVLWERSKRDET